MRQSFPNSLVEPALSPTVSKLLMLAFVGLIALNAYLVVPLIPLAVHGYADYEILYVAGAMVKGGVADLLYDYHAQSAAHRLLLPSSLRTPSLPFNHLSYEAAFFVPLAELPFESSFYVWDLLNILMLVLVGFALRRELPAVPGWLVVLTPFAFFPDFATLGQGQDSILLLAVYVTSFIAAKRGHNEIAGGTLALGLFKYHLVLPFVFLWLLGRNWSALRGFLVGALLTVGSSIAICGTHGSIQYFKLMIETRSAWFMDPSAMPNIRGLLSSFVPRGLMLDGIAAFMSIAILLGAGTLKVPPEKDEEFDLWFAFAITITYLVSFHSYVHDMSPMLLAVVLVINHVVNYRARRTVRTLQITCCAVMLLPCFIFFLRPQLMHVLALVVMGFAGSLWMALREAHLELTAIPEQNANRPIAPSIQS